MLQERLLKPLSGFSGMSGEMRELAGIISRVPQKHTHTQILYCKNWQTRNTHAEKQTCKGADFIWTWSHKMWKYVLSDLPNVSTREQQRTLLWMDWSVVLMKAQVLSISLIWGFILKDTHLHKPNRTDVCVCVCGFIFFHMHPSLCVFVCSS